MDPENKTKYQGFVEKWKNQYESDVFSRVKRLFSGNNSGTESMQRNFMEGVKRIPIQSVQNAFWDSYGRVQFKKWDKPNSRFNDETWCVMLGKSADDTTLAHELFHEIDAQYGISEKRYLLKAMQKDSMLMDRMSERYGNSVESMIKSLYPEAFVKSDTGRTVIKIEHRGLSDILHGLFYGEVDLGYGHRKPGYWEKNLNIERETWAQIGRSLYQYDQKDIEMIRYLLPNTYKRVLEILEEVVD